MLQVIKAEEVRDGEPRIWIETPQPVMHTESRRDRGCQPCGFAIVDRPAPTPAADPLATVRAALDASSKATPTDLRAALRDIAYSLNRLTHSQDREHRRASHDEGDRRNCLPRAAVQNLHGHLGRRTRERDHRRAHVQAEPREASLGGRALRGFSIDGHGGLRSA